MRTLTNPQKAQRIAHRIATKAYLWSIRRNSTAKAIEVACGCYCAAFDEALAHLDVGRTATQAADMALSVADVVYCDLNY